MDNFELSPLGRPGFPRLRMQGRYDISEIDEDAWHRLSGHKTADFVRTTLIRSRPEGGRLLNAGAGRYRIRQNGWDDVSFDIFAKPIRDFPQAVVGNVESLPFRGKSFQAVICVGEVLSYCDPSRAIRQFADVLDADGILLVDFASTRSPRYWLSPVGDRLVDRVFDEYNGSREEVWIYSPFYIRDVLEINGFKVFSEMSTHGWSSIAKRAGIPLKYALAIETLLGGLLLPSRWADLKTIAALKKT